MIIRLTLLGVLLCGIAHSQTSADNPRLKSALERHPEADVDKNGILTLEEAKAFQDKTKAFLEFKATVVLKVEGQCTEAMKG